MKIQLCIITCLLTFISLFINSCIPNNANIKPPITISEIEGSKSDKISKIVKTIPLVNQNINLKHSIKNANLIQKKIGDGNFGSSDYFTFIALEIDQKEIPNWKKITPKLQNKSDKSNIYVNPPKLVDWWVSESEFKELEFFDSMLTNQGWMGISEQGKVYIYSFTN
jgi:hypothetical protein